MTWNIFLVFSFALLTDLLACLYVAMVSRNLLVVALAFHWLNDGLSHGDWFFVLQDPSLILWSFWGQGIGGTLGTIIGMNYKGKDIHALFGRMGRFAPRSKRLRKPRAKRTARTHTDAGAPADVCAPTGVSDSD